MGVALRGRPRVVVFDARSARRRGARRASSAEGGLVHRRGARRRRVRRRRRGVRRRVPAGRRRSRARDIWRRAKRAFVSTRCSVAPTATCTSIRRRAFPARWRSRRRSRGGSRQASLFATCYADLDHFKEFNDRYSYYEGDRVIRILAQILHDVVKGLCHEEGFVGHIGGDDFIFIIPIAGVTEVCAEIVSIFDALAPYQYSEQDRRAGYFFGKDRRGQLHRVPLMTVSIGVVTNERRHFTHAAQVSALATEMKSYAKTLPGSVYSIDRRTDAAAPSGTIATSLRASQPPWRMEETRSERFVSRSVARFFASIRRGFRRRAFARAARCAAR